MVLKNPPKSPQQAGEPETTGLDKLLKYWKPIVALVVISAVGALVLLMVRSAAKQAEFDAWQDSRSAISRAEQAILRGDDKSAAESALNEIDAKIASHAGASVEPALIFYKARLQAFLGQTAAAKQTLEALRSAHPDHPIVAAQGDTKSPIDTMLSAIGARDSFFSSHGKPFEARAKPQDGLSVTITFKDFGDVKLGFFSQYAPDHVANFIRLARAGEYDGTAIHRITPFCIQGGDPNSKNDDPKDDGQGSPGYTVEREATMNPIKHTRGTLSAARAPGDYSPDSGSQFFVCTKDESFLDRDGYTPYGEVIAGMDVVDKIFQQPTMGAENKEGLAADRPVNPIVIEKVAIEGDFSLPETEMPGYLERKKKAEEEKKK